MVRNVSIILQVYFYKETSSYQNCSLKIRINTAEHQFSHYCGDCGKDKSST